MACPCAPFHHSFPCLAGAIPRAKRMLLRVYHLSNSPGPHPSNRVYGGTLMRGIGTARRIYCLWGRSACPSVATHQPCVKWSVDAQNWHHRASWCLVLERFMVVSCLECRRIKCQRSFMRQRSLSTAVLSGSRRSSTPSCVFTLNASLESESA